MIKFRIRGWWVVIDNSGDIVSHSTVVNLPNKKAAERQAKDMDLIRCYGSPHRAAHIKEVLKWPHNRPYRKINK